MPKNYSPAVVWAVIILSLTLTPGNYIPQPPWAIFQLDKLVHFGIFFIQALLAIRGAYFKEQHTHKITYLLLFVLCTVFGILIELIQDYVPGRSMSPADAIANTAGVLTGLWLAPKIRFRY